jgi:hypothetical protein
MKKIAYETACVIGCAAQKWMPYLAIATGNVGRFGIGGVIELAAVGVMMIQA